jgi:predicted transcriptional regulator
LAEKFTTTQFIEAIPGTGGIVSAIASKVNCDWHTARKYIDEHPTVKQAYDDERSKITDKARHNIVKSIHDGDLMMSKWWLQVMDEEFLPKQRQELTGAGGGAIEMTWKQFVEQAKGKPE